jgi:hypothetical protein
MMSNASVLPNNMSMKELDAKLNSLADLFFKENLFFEEKGSVCRITQSIVDDWIIQHNDIVTLDLSYYLYGRLNSRLLKIRYNSKLKDLEGSGHK